MTHLRITHPDAPDDREWHLARHYHANSPEKQGSCIGLPLTNTLPMPSHYAEPSRQPRTHSVGTFDDWREAGEAHDDYVRELGLARPLNFGEGAA